MSCQYGDLRRVDTTGASFETARADGKQAGGVAASHSMAADDLNAMNRYKSLIISVGQAKGVDPAVIAGIISRESRAGKGLDSNGWGDHGNAFGLMQIDKRWHTPQGGPFSETHISQATQILVDIINFEVKKKFSSWTKEEQLKAGLAGYNMGLSRVHSYERVDESTTGKDYSNDVIARAQWYKSNGF
ncbi:lysozyme G [Esox lucius]|uniref:Lysozyme g n=2 Tax=Esox lucius TaxID=8010 RepID=A0AAY5KHT1_ESOLU|nr:lysozyme G [Esox lucius]